jgi:hypothetical protein
MNYCRHRSSAASGFIVPLSALLDGTPSFRSYFELNRHVVRRLQRSSGVGSTASRRAKRERELTSPYTTAVALHHRGHRNAEPRRHRAAALAAQYRRNHALTKVIGKRPDHRCWPPNIASRLFPNLAEVPSSPSASGNRAMRHRGFQRPITPRRPSPNG